MAGSGCKKKNTLLVQKTRDWDLLCSQNRDKIEMRECTHTVRGARTTAAVGAVEEEARAVRIHFRYCIISSELLLDVTLLWIVIKKEKSKILT